MKRQKLNVVIFLDAKGKKKKNSKKDILCEFELGSEKKGTKLCFTKI